MHKLLFFLALGILPTLTFAHGDSPSLEAEVNEYLVDIGVSQEGIRPGEEVTFDFDLFTTDDRPQFVHFGSVDVEIKHDDTVLLSEVIANDSTYIPTLAYTFREEGEYRLTASFLTGSTVIASQGFDLAVAPGSGTAARFENATHYVIAAILVGFTLVYGMVSFLRRKSA